MPTQIFTQLVRFKKGESTGTITDGSIIERNAQPDAFQNIGDGLWWAIVAFTTVGYGDIYPITPVGKLLSSIISLIGIAIRLF